MPSAHREMLRFGLPLTFLIIIFLATAQTVTAYPVLRLVLDAAGIITCLLLLFVCFFFRDPERTVPADPNLVVAPADGLVVGVEEMDEPDFQLGRRLRIAVFLSVFDVHVNRSPVGGRVLQTSHKAGKFLDVRHPDCSTQNEALAWLLETPQGPVAVRQIAGLVARRIVAWSKQGDPLERGQRFGMIRFGSRTEIFLPVGCQPLVKPGDRVRGAATPIARWNPQEKS